MIGQTLRHYRIETKLGAGGMGVVYRARDTHLDRSIAIKILPPNGSVDEERSRRLAQEAKAASALNHPNIITIYDVGSYAVHDTPVEFIAMEFVSGKTLDRLIGRKGLPLTSALRYAVQIADALAAAHAAGIIHRDLKPANLMANDQGLVKVLDFGLAKLAEPSKPDVFAATESVHIALELKTEAGTILGTVAYMSPEQAEGKEIDARSDIFSFGAVLYEMVTGRRAFAGDSKLSVLATILQKDPPPVRDLVEGVPREVEKIISRCLEKDPQRRWQSMADLKLALEDLLQDIEAGRLDAGPTPVARRRSMRWLLAIALTLAGLAGSGSYIAGRLHRNPPANFQRLTFRRGDVTSARFAPDGRTIVYNAEWDGAPSEIFSTLAGYHESRSLGLPPGKVLAISSTGEIAILLGEREEGTLARVPLAGGSPREVLEHVTDADWGPDGSTLAVIRTVGGKNRIEYPIGKVLYETTGRPPYSLSVSPDGTMLAFFDYDGEMGDFAVAVVGTDGRKRNLCRGWRGITRLTWVPKGDEIWFSATHLGADPALEAVTLSGKQRTVAQMPGWMVIQDIAKDGQVLMSVSNSRIAASYRSMSEKTERDMSWLDTSYVYDLSHDGREMLLLELSYGEGRNPAIYLRKTDGSPAVLLGHGNRPAFSPDGKSVVAIRTDPDKSQLVVLPTGPGEQRFLTTKGLRYESAEWIPGGDRILFTASDQGHPMRTYVQSLAGGPPQPVSPEGVRGGQVSPDGKYMVVTSGSKYTLFPLTGGESRVIGDVEPGERPVGWSTDGRYLYLRQFVAEGRGLQFWRLEAATGRRQVWTDVSPADPVGVTFASAVVAPDGSSYAYSYQRDISNLYLVKGLD